MPLPGVRQMLTVRWIRERGSLDALVSAPCVWLCGGVPLHTAEVTGSIPVAPTTNPQLRGRGDARRHPPLPGVHVAAVGRRGGAARQHSASHRLRGRVPGSGARSRCGREAPNEDRPPFQRLSRALLPPDPLARPASEATPLMPSRQPKQDPGLPPGIFRRGERSPGAGRGPASAGAKASAASLRTPAVPAGPVGVGRARDAEKVAGPRWRPLDRSASALRCLVRGRGDDGLPHAGRERAPGDRQPRHGLLEAVGVDLKRQRDRWHLVGHPCPPRRAIAVAKHYYLAPARSRSVTTALPRWGRGRPRAVLAPAVSWGFVVGATGIEPVTSAV